jgi:ribulose-5-phosphate 4-epimerase/fuculose-1-phosphate aldolase
MTILSDTPDALVAAAQRLQAKGLMAVGDSLSMRLAGEHALQFVVVSVDGVPASARVEIAGAEHLASVDASLPGHLAIYLVRDDVGAVFIGKPNWACALAATSGAMPAIFDEQVRHLGSCVVALDADLPSSTEALRTGDNAFLVDRRVACFGMTLDRVVFNTELLEKCAKAYVLAHCTGKPVGRIPWLVRWIANGRLKKDEKHSAREYAAGRVPVFKSAY